MTAHDPWAGRHYTITDMHHTRCDYCGGQMVAALIDATGWTRHPACPEPPPKRKPRRPRTPRGRRK